ncbi:hypothetical protein B7G68_05855 [Caulobacter segnis]|uniref:Uncharacterized protein n=2 Tax=Caulobacter segnis TaxID=88688 RepID=D5VFA4_CAUST|nr:hypothetical protein [Caulobacter segnis]ADG09636.1 hypothetical protein Cseg_1134 [Caulobacter segnis ATCC 21756]AVQ01416.1 hypothetical protein B7G68_05855 [Caulobacter segnis]
MSEELPTLKSADIPAGKNEAASRAELAEPALAYDYFKSMASISVATLGGILTLGGTVFGARIAPWQMGISALAVALSGLLALQAQTDIMQLRQGVKPPLNSSRAALRLVPALFGLGLGIFLAFLLLSYFAPGVAARLR